MSVRTRVKGGIFEGGAVVLLARVRLPATGAPIVQSDLSSIVYQVTEVSRTPFRVTRVATGLVIANVVFNTLQIDSRWDVDSVGFNFVHIVPAADFPSAFVEENRPQKFLVDYKFTPTSGEAFRIGYELEAIKTPAAI
jgi:hypothetical protein